MAWYAAKQSRIGSERWDQGELARVAGLVLHFEAVPLSLSTYSVLYCDFLSGLRQTVELT
jgi:hypothetical protein